MSPPLLPNELWAKILNLTVNLPGQYQTKNDLEHPLFWNAEDDNTGDSILNDDYRQSLLVKMAITETCRLFRDIGSGLLYEHFRFNGWDERKGFEVVNTLRGVLKAHRLLDAGGRLDGGSGVMAGSGDSTNEDSTQPHLDQQQKRHDQPAGYGNATKRIDFPVSLLHTSHLPKLLKLLHECRHIRILSLIPGPPGIGCNLANVRSLFHFIFPRFKHSLRRIDFGLSRYDLDPEETIFHSLLLPPMPLDTLELGITGDLAVGTIPAPEALFHIRTLTLVLVDRMKGMDLPYWICPNLRHLTLKNVSEADVLALLGFFALHGNQLYSLRLASCENGLDVLPLLLSTVPNLRQLIFDPTCISTEGLRRLTLAPKWNLEDVGLENRHYLLPKQIWPFLYGIFPRLRRLRLLDGSDLDDWEESPVGTQEWDELIHCVTTRNLIFDDRYGSSFVD